MDYNTAVMTTSEIQPAVFQAGPVQGSPDIMWTLVAEPPAEQVATLRGELEKYVFIPSDAEITLPDGSILNFIAPENQKIGEVHVGTIPTVSYIPPDRSTRIEFPLPGIPVTENEDLKEKKFVKMVTDEGKIAVYRYGEIGRLPIKYPKNTLVKGAERNGFDATLLDCFYQVFGQVEKPYLKPMLEYFVKRNPPFPLINSQSFPSIHDRRLNDTYVFYSKKLEFGDNIALHLEDGAVIVFSAIPYKAPEKPAS